MGCTRQIARRALTPYPVVRRRVSRMAAGDGVDLDPTDWDSVRAQGHRILDDMVDHLQGLRAQPVWREPPPYVRAAFREALPVERAPLAEVYDRFADHVLPYSSGHAHPAFMGW